MFTAALDLSRREEEANPFGAALALSRTTQQTGTITVGLLIEVAPENRAGV